MFIILPHPSSFILSSPFLYHGQGLGFGLGRGLLTM